MSNPPSYQAVSIHETETAQAPTRHRSRSLGVKLLYSLILLYAIVSSFLSSAGLCFLLEATPSLPLLLLELVTISLTVALFWVLGHQQEPRHTFLPLGGVAAATCGLALLACLYILDASAAHADPNTLLVWLEGLTVYYGVGISMWLLLGYGL